MGATDRSICWLGAGAYLSKCSLAVKEALENGVKVYVADICDKPTGLSHVDPTDFFNLSHKVDRQRLDAIGRTQPFDLLYVATYPQNHVLEAIRRQAFARSTIISKPLDSIEHLPTIQTVTAASSANQYDEFIEGTRVHDHYRNKPVVAALQQIMPTLHGQHGFISQGRMFIVESAEVNDEIHRLGALECGMIYDLAVHPISILQALVPPQIKWTDHRGNEFHRAMRHIEVVGCARARSAACFLTNSGAETYAAIELKVTETILHTRTQHEVKRGFPVLIVVGKGCPVDWGGAGDLKGFEISFDDGQAIRANLDTHGILGGNITTLMEAAQIQINRRQRGMNAPIRQFIEADFDITAKGPGGYDLFQGFNEATENAEILAESLIRGGADPFPYAAGIPVHDLLNRLISDGRVNNCWRIAQPLTQLVIGNAPTDAEA